MTAVAFEQPDLRTTNKNLRGSTYQHPHTDAIVPSVTTISGLMDKSGFLVPWGIKLAAEYAADNYDLISPLDRAGRVGAIKEGAEVLRSAGRDLGSLAHNTIEAISLGVPTDIPAEVMHHVTGWSEWVAKFVESFLLVEATVWSHAHHYAGTLDVVAILKDGRHCLVDYKTGKDVPADAALQLTALRNADCIVTTDGEAPMPRIDCAAVLHLPAPVMTPTGKVSVRGKWCFREVRTSQREMDIFLALRSAYDWEHEDSKDVIGGKQTSPKS
jgi:hypothetical protein